MSTNDDSKIFERTTKSKPLKRIFFALFLISLISALISGFFGSGIEVLSFFLILCYIFSTIGFSIPYFHKTMESALFTSFLLAIFVSPMFIYDIVLLVRILGTKNLAVVADSKTWIGFAGSIIGGCVTMLAVLFTIRNEDKKRRIDKEEMTKRINSEKQEILEKRKKDSMPIPRISLIPLEKKNMVKSINDQLALSLSNLTTNAMVLYSVELDTFNYETVLGSNESKVKIESRHPIIYEAGDKIIPGLASIQLIVRILDNTMFSFLFMELRNESSIRCVIGFSIYYTDIYNLQKYKMDTGLYFKVNFAELDGGVTIEYWDLELEVPSIPKLVSEFPPKSIEKMWSDLQEVKKNHETVKN